MPAAALSAMTGLIPVTVGAGVVMKITERMFPQQQSRAPRRQRQERSYRRTGRDVFDVGFGNFSNLRGR